MYIYRSGTRRDFPPKILLRDMTDAKVVEKVFALVFRPGTTIDDKALQVLAHYFDIFVNEAVERANDARQQQQQHDDTRQNPLVNTALAHKTITQEHLNKIAGNLALDF